MIKPVRRAEDMSFKKANSGYYHSCTLSHKSAEATKITKSCSREEDFNKKPR